MKSNKDFKVYLPIAFALVLILGIIIGKNLNNNSQTIGKKGITGLNKLNDVLNYINESYVDSINTDDFTDKAIQNILAELDPHSSYIPASEMQSIAESMEGSFEGIGIQFQIIKDTIVVITPIEGGPSKSVGIQPGDRIIKVDTTHVAGCGITNNDVLRLLKGKKGSKVTVTIARQSIKKPIKFTITRDVIPINSVDVSYKVDAETGYIKINKFGATTYDEFTAEIKKLKSQHIKNLIIDLRENPGGYLQVATAMADELLPKGELIVYTQGNTSGKKEYFAERKGMAEDLKIAVLINEGSASASEIIAGAIQDNDRGIVVGRRSFGKGLVQEEMPFADHSAVRLTTARYYTPSGRCIQKPYSLGKAEKYENELNERMLHGEFQNSDSIQFADSIKFKTKKGRTVFAGGGIMPDIFVPINNSQNTVNIALIIGTGNLHDFAFTFADQNRDLYKNKTVASFSKDYDVKLIFNSFLKNLEAKNKTKFTLTVEETKFLKLFLKAQIARNLFGNDEYYKLMQQNDEILNTALRALKK